MKKTLVITLALILLLGSIATPASACVTVQPMTAVAVDDGGSGRSTAKTTSSGSNSNTTTQTASSGGVNQNATVQGDGNAVNIRQTVNKASDNYVVHQNTTVNNTTIIQVVECEPESPHPDYQKMKEVISVYGNAFIKVLANRLHDEGWTLIWSVNIVQTHNCVFGLTFISAGLTISNYKLLYYTGDGEHYAIALTTAYHAGWRVADYPTSEIVFRGLSEADAIEMILNWLFVQVEISTAPACSCCAHCTCNGACGAGCSCGE